MVPIFFLQDEYYDVGLRGYPRPRVEYGEEPVASGHYNESARFVHASLLPSLC